MHVPESKPQLQQINKPKALDSTRGESVSNLESLCFELPHESPQDSSTISTSATTRKTCIDGLSIDSNLAIDTLFLDDDNKEQVDDIDYDVIPVQEYQRTPDTTSEYILNIQEEISAIDDTIKSFKVKRRQLVKRQRSVFWKSIFSFGKRVA
ncbi:hypothetical protein FOA43_002601 [Brettanomyces nanus]|uniref:Uncharacterized protein n=1 Tax=Eeniella nana TaxID=13502 RepID=A0A875S0E8_EENNA|nr:uncharacterized protein FOA43_002601 [Brettanomyces nanus]QPG75251.1 hypothetical protein FOA43_002601 [Brettanomyces nanus]